MSQSGSQNFRIAVIAALAKRSKSALGRTALMKSAYLLQTLKGVPLDYSFRLYTYGPYEAQVIEDLKIGEMKGAVKSTIIGYPSGYGYEIRPGDQADAVVDDARDELLPHEPAIDWVIEEFGNRTAIDLEMTSTIVYVDRALRIAGEGASVLDLAARMHAIKPRLPTARIEAEILTLEDKGLLTSVH